jgi:hypothetical protein
MGFCRKELRRKSEVGKYPITNIQYPVGEKKEVGYAILEISSIE